MSNNNLLFYGKSLRDHLSRREAEMINEIQRWGLHSFKDASDDSLIDSVVAKYAVDPPPRLDRDGVYLKEDGETGIDVSGHRDIDVRDRSRPFYVPGSYITVAIPFEGDGGMFGFKASTYSLNPPRGHVSGSEILITLQGRDLDKERVHEEINGTIGRLEQHLEWLKEDCDNWNSRIRTMAGQLVQNRKQRLIEHEQRVSSIGLPRKKRS